MDSLTAHLTGMLEKARACRDYGPMENVGAYIDTVRGFQVACQPEIIAALVEVVQGVLILEPSGDFTDYQDANGEPIGKRITKALAALGKAVSP